MMNQDTPISIANEEREQALALFRAGQTRGQVQIRLGWGNDRYPQLATLHAEYLVGVAAELRAEGMDDLAVLCRLLGWSESEQTRALLERVLAAQGLLRRENTLEEGDAWPVVCDLLEVLATWRPSRGEICLALGNAGPILASPAPGQLGPVAIAGATGRGKSTVLRLLLAQLAPLFPRACYLINPHFAPLQADGTDWRPLLPRLAGVARTGEEIETMLAWAVGEMEERGQREIQGDLAWKDQGVYIAVDSLSEVVRRAPRAQQMLCQLLARGRSRGIVLLLAAQDGLGDLPGDPASFQVAYYLGGAPTQGRRLLGVQARDLAEDVVGVEGACLLRPDWRAGWCRARVPLPGNAALAALCEEENGAVRGD
jgi:hypothetical protein